MVLTDLYADLSPQKNQTHKSNAIAKRYGNVACEEYLTALEACTLLATDVSSAEQETHRIRMESLELSNRFREVLSCAKKLLKERDELSVELNGLQSQVMKVNNTLVADLQLLLQENESLREKKNGGKKPDVVHDRIKETISSCNSLHRKWQEQQKHWFSEPWASEVESRLLVAEELWRCARSRLGRPVDPCRNSRTIFSERLRQVRRRHGYDSDCEPSFLKTPPRDMFDEQWPTSSGLHHNVELITSGVREQQRAGHSRVCKLRRGRRPQDIGELKRVRSAPQITRSQRKNPPLVKLSPAIYGEAALPLPDFGGPTEATCSVLEIIEPTGDDTTNCETGQNCLVGEDRMVIPMPFPKSRKNGNFINMPAERDIDSSLNTQGSFNVTDSCDGDRENVPSDSGLSRVSAEANEEEAEYQEENEVQCVSKRKEDESVIMKQDQDDSIAGSLMSAEPDLIKGTKGIRSYEETSLLLSITPPLSESSEITHGGGDNFFADMSEENGEAPPLPLPRTSKTLPLDSSSLSISPSRRKGFLQKFSLRWSSKRKADASKAPGKKSQEISPADFRETYMQVRNNGGDGDVQQDPPSDEVIPADSNGSSEDQEPQMDTDSRVEENDELNPNVADDDGLEENDTGAFQVPPPVPSSQQATSGQTSILTLQDLASRRDERGVRSLVGFSRTEESIGEAMPRPASSASKSEPLSRPESSASRMDLSVLKAAGFTLQKVSSLTTEMHPDSSTASRMSPAPSEVSKTESALLSPSSDVSRTESALHLRQLGRIEEIVNRETKPTLLPRPKVQVKRAVIMDIGPQEPPCTPATGSETTGTSANDVGPGVNPARKRHQEEKPWYDLSDDEDMLTPARLQRPGLRSSSEEEEENFIHSN